MSRVEQLRQQFPVFTYQTATYSLANDRLVLEFEYQTQPNQAYRHTVVLHEVTEQQLAAVPPEEIAQLVHHIGMIEAFSYWKATCSPQFQVNAFPLSSHQLAWWHTLLLNGMGEYFFVNQIEFTAADFITIVSESNSTAQQQSAVLSRHNVPIPQITVNSHILVPIGGGKDSVVSLEFLRSQRPSETLGCLLVNPTQAALDCAALSGIARVHQVTRQFDPQLKQFTQEQGLNGHVPVSASFAWISLLVARLQGYQHIALSNEASSNEGSVEYLGKTINHQYSKTFAFESSLQQYVNAWLPPQTPWYFSLLRPLHELQIAELFAQYTQYHAAFRSCNRGQKTNTWCGNCPKCLFAYLILSPFLPQSQLVQLFGSNVLANDTLWPELQQLLGITAQKPLECVGTRAESLAAAHMTIQRLTAENQPLPSLLTRLSTEPLLQQPDLDALALQIRNSWNKQHSVPSTLAEALSAKIKAIRNTTAVSTNS